MHHSQCNLIPPALLEFQRQSNRMDMNNSEKSCSEVVPLLLHRHFVVRLQLEAITKGLLFQSKDGTEYLFSLSFMFSFILGEHACCMRFILVMFCIISSS